MKKTKLLLTSLLILLTSCDKVDYNFHYETITPPVEDSDVDINNIYGTYSYSKVKYTQDPSYLLLNEDKTFILHMYSMTIATGTFTLNEAQDTLIFDITTNRFEEHFGTGTDPNTYNEVKFDKVHGLLSLDLSDGYYFEFLAKDDGLFGKYSFYCSYEKYNYYSGNDNPVSITFNNDYSCSYTYYEEEYDKFGNISGYKQVTETGTWEKDKTKITATIDLFEYEYTYSSLNNCLLLNDDDVIIYVTKK